MDQERSSVSRVIVLQMRESIVMITVKKVQAGVVVGVDFWLDLYLWIMSMTGLCCETNESY